MRVVQPGQHALFLRKALQHALRVQAVAQHLDGGVAFVGAVGPVGAPDLAHATPAQQSVDLPGADALPFAAGRGGCVGQDRADQGRRLGEKTTGAGAVQFGMGQQRLQLATQRIADGRRSHGRGTLGRWQGADLVEQRAQPGPIGR